jgi:[ribosomal protein S5]-alanine N-acetyltransferase
MLNLNFTLFPTLDTSRLILRQPSMDDKHEVFALRSSEIVNKHLDRPMAKSVEDAVRHMEKIMGMMDRTELITWVINLKGSKKQIGDLGYMNFSQEMLQAEIGYQLLPEYHGKGIMTEAVEKVIDYGAKIIGLKKIVAVTTEANASSVRLLKKFGFRLNPDFREGNEVEIQYVLDVG